MSTREKLLVALSSAMLMHGIACSEDRIKEPTQAPVDRWHGNPPDRIDSDGVPVYHTRMGPPGISYRKRSIDDPPECKDG